MGREGRDFDILPRDGPGRDFDTGQKEKREKKNTIFYLFIYFFLFFDFCQSSSDFVLGQRDNETSHSDLSRDKWTMGHPIPDCPGTSWDCPVPLETLANLDIYKHVIVYKHPQIPDFLMCSYSQLYSKSTFLFFAQISYLFRGLFMSLLSPKLPI